MDEKCFYIKSTYPHNDLIEYNEISPHEIPYLNVDGWCSTENNGILYTHVDVCLYKNRLVKTKHHYVDELLSKIYDKKWD